MAHGLPLKQSCRLVGISRVYEGLLFVFQICGEVPVWFLSVLHSCHVLFLSVPPPHPTHTHTPRPFLCPLKENRNEEKKEKKRNKSIRFVTNYLYIFFRVVNVIIYYLCDFYCNFILFSSPFVLLFSRFFVCNFVCLMLELGSYKLFDLLCSWVYFALSVLWCHMNKPCVN